MKLPEGNINYLSFFLIVSFVSSMLFSCDVTPEIADIKVDDHTQRLVVDGLVSDQPGPYSVKLSLTANVYSKEVQSVNDAFVFITDNLGSRDVLTRTEAGMYETDSLVGKVGNTYTLTVIYHGKTYTSISRMSNGITIDSLRYKFQKKTLVYDEGYYLTVYGTVPEEKGNYYRWYVAENDTVDKDITLSDDKFLDSKLENITIDRMFDLGDKARLEIHSLNEAEYKYYVGLENIIDGDGGLFSSPPKNPEGNVSNGALGIFRASKVSWKEITIE